MQTRKIMAVPRRSRLSRTRLLAGVMALGAAGALSVQTIVPNQFALADPVKVDVAGPADFSPVVTAVQPAVVSVRVKQAVEPRMMNFGNDFGEFFNDLPKDHPLHRFFRRFGEEGLQGRGGERQQPRPYGLSQGSGFFISEDGYLVTNHHVIDKGTEFTIITQDGKEYDAALIGADSRTDLALLKVEDGDGFTYVKFAEDAPNVGEWVVAIGNPFGLGGSVTAGIVSARGRDIGAGPYDDFIQIDAPVNRGNSGGPAFNMKGEVIGVNAAIFSPSGGNVGIAFAIPSSTATEVIMDLRQDGAVVRGWLGVQIQNVSEDIAASLGLDEAKGAIVAEAQPGSPATQAGIRSGDTILAVDGTEVDGPRDLSKIIAAYEPDTKVEITVWRGNKERDITVTLGTLEDTETVVSAQVDHESGRASLDDLGLALVTVEEAGVGGEGAIIEEIEAGSPAAEKGLRRGDRIIQVAGVEITSPADVVAAVEAAGKEGRKAVLFRVESNDRARFVALPMTAG